MSTALRKLEEQALALSPEEKAELAHALIEDLDGSGDPGAERLWLEEARRRYDAFRAGETSALQGAEAMKRARKRLG
jgi:hypothetical protein